ncbi:enoyl-CoA hydratase family protein [Nocardioides acrostichi]|uniref:Enoyl-CoA hydratase family protein n=1 Tax=Nocardioides acrostichi TaxID=2784339 RepID=A0A930YC61_9ACTN|nr:enoyl-CoA hydratase family protein [Nocardioides acrostichi]MBF4161169.1 enoyl-CoA hydratase family protein [Nocardioides acrostichi]
MSAEQSTPQPAVHYDVADGVATLTLDSPHNRNALSRALVTGLFEALDRAATDDAATVVVIAATGSVFCSGADLTEARAGSMEQGAREMVRMQRAVLAHPKPVVCRLQGPVRAGGIGLVAACDVVIAAERATFALTEVKLGLAPAAISLSVLPRMSPRAASLAALGGEVFTAAQAAAWDLVTSVVPDDGLDEEVAAVCASLATGAAQGLRETKTLLNADVLARLDERAEQMAALSARLFGSEEAKAAMTAFLSRKR